MNEVCSSAGTTEQYEIDILLHLRYDLELKKIEKTGNCVCFSFILNKRYFEFHIARDGEKVMPNTGGEQTRHFICVSG